jgi:predicted transcriptional regulator
MTVELDEALADAADYSGMSKSAYAEEAIRGHLKRDKRRLAELKRQDSRVREARRLAW